jgi:RNA polymerase sigma-70 factor (ECF subfamily)
VGKTIADWHKEYFSFVFRRCFFMLRNKQDAEDAAQEVFIKLLKAQERGMELNKVVYDESLLWKIATNVCLDHIRKNRKLDDTFPLFNEEIPETVNFFERLNARLLIQAILEEESEETRIYCFMYFFDGMKLKEIAETVGKSKSWVHKKIETFKNDTRRKFEETMK